MTGKPYILILTVAVGLFPATGGAEPIAPEIEEGISAAAAAGTLATAEQILDQAETDLEASDLPAGSEQSRLLRADIRRARGQVISRFLKVGDDDPELRPRAEEMLNLALNSYENLRSGAERQAGRMAQRLLPQKRRESEAYRNAIALAARAVYSIGWTEYLLGTLQIDPEGSQAHMLRAIARFRELTSGGYRANPIVIDCFIGEAKCHLELDEPHVAAKLLAPATGVNTPPEAFKRITAVRVKALAELQLHYQIVQSVSASFATHEAGHTWNARDLGLALERVLALAHLSEAPIDAGYRKLFFSRFVQAREVFYGHGPPWPDRLIRKLGEEVDSGGYRFLKEARDHFAQEAFDLASLAARRGLEEATSGDQVLHRNLLYVIALAGWNAGDWPRCFVASLEFIRRHSGDTRAEQLCLYGMQAVRRARAVRQSLPSTLVMELYDLAEVHFDHLPQVKQVPWYRAHLLLETGRFAEAERELRQLPESSPMYWEGQYGLAMAALQLASSSDGQAARDYLEGGTTALDRFISAMPEPVPADKMSVVRAMVGLAMEMARGWLARDPPDQQRALEILERLDALGAGRTHVRRAEEALRFQIKVLDGDASVALDLVSAAVAAESLDAEMAATLSSLADHLEKQSLRADPASADQLSDMLALLYGRLLDFYSTRPGGLEPRIEIALRRRLAAVQIRRGPVEEALAHYLWLEQHVPRGQSADILRGRALAHEATGAFDQALSAWRQLKDGLGRGNEDWIEASYHVASCHAALGHPDVADKSLKLLLLQVPEAGQGRWANEIKDLQQRIELAIEQEEASRTGPGPDGPAPGPGPEGDTQETTAQES